MRKGIGSERWLCPASLLSHPWFFTIHYRSCPLGMVAFYFPQFQGSFSSDSEFPFSPARGTDQHLGDQQRCLYKHVCPGNDPETCCFWPLWLPPQPLQHLWQYHRHHQVIRVLGINWNTYSREHHKVCGFSCAFYRKNLAAVTEKKGMSRYIRQRIESLRCHFPILLTTLSASVPHFSVGWKPSWLSCKSTTNTSCKIFFRMHKWRVLQKYNVRWKDLSHQVLVLKSFLHSCNK